MTPDCLEMVNENKPKQWLFLSTVGLRLQKQHEQTSLGFLTAITFHLMDAISSILQRTK